jgi:hypothetical protein
MAFKFDVFRKLVSRAPTPAPQRSDVEAAIADAVAEIARANAEIGRLAPVRQNVLIHGTDADLEKHDALVSAEMRSRDRAVALKEQLTGRLSEIDAIVRNEEMERQRVEAEKLFNAACADLKKYPDLASQILDILIAVARADAAGLAFNQKYPDQSPIGDAEASVRRDPGPPKKILSEKTVELWADRKGEPVAPFNQDKVVPVASDPKKGQLRISSTYAEDVELRPFRCVEFLPEQSGWAPPRLDASLVLPGFFGSSPAVYAPNVRTELLTRMTGQKLAAVPTVPRTPQVEFIPIASTSATPSDDSGSAAADSSINAA